MHGGVAKNVHVNGDLHMHGGVIERLTVEGDCHQTGGIVERRIILAGGATIIQQQPEQPKVIYRDRVVYRDKPTTDPKISSLQSYNQQLRSKLQKANNEIAALNEELAKTKAAKKASQDVPDDNVLVSRIEHLQNQLANEREESKRKVDELEWRLKAITDIANGRNERIYEDETNGRKIEVPDDSLDVLFTLINSYPITPDEDLVDEFGISITKLKYIAKALRLAKSPEQRREARERLQRHGSDLIERRGGDHGNQFKKSKTKRK